MKENKQNQEKKGSDKLPADSLREFRQQNISYILAISIKAETFGGWINWLREAHGIFDGPKTSLGEVLIIKTLVRHIVPTMICKEALSFNLLNLHCKYQNGALLLQNQDHISYHPQSLGDTKTTKIITIITSFHRWQLSYWSLQ